MEILYIQLLDDAYISISKQLTLMVGFVVQGHKYAIICYNLHKFPEDKSENCLKSGLKILFDFFDILDFFTLNI